jgi:hypothetical protein
VKKPRKLKFKSWAVAWESKNSREHRSHYLWDMGQAPALFRTRALARAFADERLGYIRKRPDLRAEPYGWKMPQAVRVTVTVDVTRKPTRKPTRNKETK